MVRLTEPAGSVVRPNLAEPPSSADADADADSSVVHYNLNNRQVYVYLFSSLSAIFLMCLVSRSGFALAVR